MSIDRFMMSKERESLKRLVAEMNLLAERQGLDPIVCEIEEPLAQPEQKPVAWRWKTHKRNYYKYSEENYHELEGEPLYASPPKRDPIDLDQVDNHLKICDLSEDYRDGYSDGIIFAEKAHGIGVGDEKIHARF